MPDIVHKKLLLTGFQPNVPLPQPFREHYGTEEEIGAKIRNDHARIQRAGITPVACLLDSQEIEKSLKEMEELLREGGYDAIGIGAGVRIVPAHLALFERMVNMCITLAPGVPLFFNDGPGGNTAASE
ncbi:hypothetical protein F5B22DRAFT_7512 [Xylaria bambusicola]|uniref:uncharacterized protein n=1 Tax=Xylaria bambusicola TaxID=326684 RepID=UPI0020073E8B|nr:uncharacterized protein F5B22DRAFT_7512 [Xylaria bambusicola]KAI0527859.1 hypothetical protein F5B22DRAFT_7512 [Xylaria bambusicola]